MIYKIEVELEVIDHFKIVRENLQTYPWIWIMQVSVSRLCQSKPHTKHEHGAEPMMNAAACEKQINDVKESQEREESEESEERNDRKDWNEKARGNKEKKENKEKMYK